MNHGEQVIALEAPDDGVLVGRHGSRIGMVDVQGHDGRIAELGEGHAQLIHAHEARRPLHEVLPGDPVQREGGPGRCAGQDAAAGSLPGAADGGQAGDGADGHGAVAVPGQAAPQADEGRLCGGKLPCHAFDDGSRQTTDRGHPLRGAIVATPFRRTPRTRPRYPG